MSSRREFMRNTLMALAASLLPKTLLPQDEPLFRQIGKYYKKVVYYCYGSKDILDDHLSTDLIVKMLRRKAEREHPNAIHTRSDQTSEYDDFFITNKVLFYEEYRYFKPE